MAWTKEQFIDFCNKCGVDPKKALKEGSVNLRGRPVTWSTLGSIAAKQKRKNNALRAISKIQDTLRESDQAVALDKEVCGQAEGMESPKVSFRVQIIGLRVRPIDPDNFCAGCKGIIDGLVESGIITGDDWKTTAITTAQRKVNTWNLEGTLVIIESAASAL